MPPGGRQGVAVALRITGAAFSLSIGRNRRDTAAVSYRSARYCGKDRIASRRVGDFMGRFYFDIHNGTGLTPDDEGQDLGDSSEARNVALKGIRSMLIGELSEGTLDLTGHIDVTDARHVSVMIVPFAEAVTIVLP